MLYDERGGAMGDDEAPSLLRVLDDPVRREAITADLVRLVDEEVRGRSGMSGAALRAGYATFQRIKPGIVRLAVDRLLPELAVAVQPSWEEAARSGSDRCFTDRAEEIAEQMLTVTDRMSERATNRVLKRLYASLRPSARRHVARSVPRLPTVIRRHAG
jgi:hypothetical protein